MSLHTVVVDMKLNIPKRNEGGRSYRLIRKAYTTYCIARSGTFTPTCYDT